MSISGQKFAGIELDRLRAQRPAFDIRNARIVQPVQQRFELAYIVKNFHLGMDRIVLPVKGDHVLFPQGIPHTPQGRMEVAVDLGIAEIRPEFKSQLIPPGFPLVQDVKEQSPRLPRIAISTAG